VDRAEDGLAEPVEDDDLEGAPVAHEGAGEDRPEAFALLGREAEGGPRRIDELVLVPRLHPEQELGELLSLHDVDFTLVVQVQVHGSSLPACGVDNQLFST